MIFVESYTLKPNKIIKENKEDELSLGERLMLACYFEAIRATDGWFSRVEIQTPCPTGGPTLDRG